MALPLPPLNLNLNSATSSGAKAGDLRSEKNGNVYNFGGSNGVVPAWVWAAGAAAVAFWFLKKKG